MKYLLILAIVSVECACTQLSKEHEQEEGALTFRTSPLVLPRSLQDTGSELQINVASAQTNIQKFARDNGWEDLANEVYFDTVRIFDNKAVFNTTLLKLAGADTLMELPDTYCAALEQRTLIAMSPEFYATVYPQGIEERSYEKLLTHEIAHRLHVRILQGDEEGMGPIWFYEGFAMFVADQFSESDLTLSEEEMVSIMQDPERGSYPKYNYVFRYLVKKSSVQELVKQARRKEFNEEMIALVKKEPRK